MWTEFLSLAHGFKGLIMKVTHHDPDSQHPFPGDSYRVCSGEMLSTEALRG